MTPSLSVLAPVERVGAPRVCVTVADRGGWDVYVELNGRVMRTEHCTDWHRVERRRGQLKAEFRAPPTKGGCHD